MTEDLKPFYVRPKTRGELASRLKNEEACEVAGHVVEITVIMLEGWLDCKVTTRESENKGWVVFELEI